MNPVDEFKEMYSGETEKFEVPSVSDDYYMSAMVWLSEMKDTVADMDYTLEHYARGKTSGLNNMVRMSSQAMLDYSRHMVYNALRMWASTKRVVDSLPEDKNEEDINDFI